MTDLAIIIVNYNSTDYLAKCIKSLHDSIDHIPFRVVVIDNASRDQDFSHFSRYSSVKFILNQENVGFARACNQGIQQLDAKYFLLLNPDCVVHEGAIDHCLNFINDQTSIGILGCRVNNPDGSLQLACRRRIPRPAAAFYRFTGLSTLFPRSRRFGAYNLSYMEDDNPHEVEAVSGSFLLMRREVIETVGLMDEDFFLYGEDLDLCYRAHLGGWKIFYLPSAQVTHYKRVSSSRNAARANFHFYNAMKIFYDKHFAPEATFLERWLVRAGIQALYLARRTRNLITGEEVGSRR